MILMVFYVKQKRIIIEETDQLGKISKKIKKTIMIWEGPGTLSSII